MKEILATFITIAVALRSVSATTTLCVNGNNQIRKLYIDGEDFTKKLKGRGTYKTCDCVEIPVNSGVIAIEAMSRKDPTVRTIQSCVDSNPEIYDNWRCLPIGEKRMDSMPNWINPDYNDEKFEAPKYKKCYETCRGVKDLTCKMSKCFWTKRIAWVPRYDRNAKDIIRCRLRQCAEGCYTCATAGPGKCDNGQCILGLGTNSKTKQTICNKKCHIDVKAYAEGTTGEGYIKIVNVLTGAVDTWDATDIGDYFALFNMTTCTIFKKTFNVWADVPTFTATTFQQWNVAESGYVDIIGVELGVGGAGSDSKSYAPWISVHRLGYGDPNPLQGNKYLRLEADLTGVQYGPVTYDNSQVVNIIS